MLFVIEEWRENCVSIDTRRLFCIQHLRKRSPLPGAKLSLTERADVSVVDRSLGKYAFSPPVASNPEAVLQRQLPIGGRGEIFGFTEPVAQ